MLLEKDCDSYDDASRYPHLKCFSLLKPLFTLLSGEVGVKFG
jgi:hypothetical protein